MSMPGRDTLTSQSPLGSCLCRAEAPLLAVHTSTSQCLQGGGKRLDFIKTQSLLNPAVGNSSLTLDGTGFRNREQLGLTYCSKSASCKIVQG